MMRLVSLLALIPRLAAGDQKSCLPVQGDTIEARHIAAAVLDFNRLPPETTIFPAPAPGAVRVVFPEELRRAARLHGIDPAVEDNLCFVILTAPLSERQIHQAMLRQIKQPAEIEILDYSKVQVPDGEIVFPREGLTSPPNGDLTTPLIWRGHIQFSPQRRLPIWARVKIAVSARRVVTTSPVKAGEAIEAQQLRQETLRVFPFETDAIEVASEVVGMIARKSVPPGTLVARRWLTPPFLVQKGEPVTVESRVGGARLVLKAVAESAGRLDGWIVVRNPTSGRFFQARVAGPGKVEVAPSGYAYLMRSEKRGERR